MYTERPAPYDHKSGKVREIFTTSDGNLLLITTDRISAFDRVLGEISHKGEVLNRMSKYWFENTRQIIPNHMISTPSQDSMLCIQANTLPVEVVVRGYMTGVTGTSIWGSYERGERNIYGIPFRDGYKKNDPLDKPIITPTTKAQSGHDERLTEQEIVERGIVEGEVWNTVSTAALNLFAFAQKASEERGYLLVDTKMEFGLDENGQVMVIDELFTPDSSRFWLAGTAQGRIAQGLEPENYDKEYLRIAFAQMGYTGEGEPPPIPEEVSSELSRRYIKIFEDLTGEKVIG